MEISFLLSGLFRLLLVPLSFVRVPFVQNILSVAVSESRTPCWHLVTWCQSVNQLRVSLWSPANTLRQYAEWSHSLVNQSLVIRKRCVKICWKVQGTSFAPCRRTKCLWVRVGWVGVGDGEVNTGLRESFTSEDSTGSTPCLYEWCNMTERERERGGCWVRRERKEKVSVSQNVFLLLFKCIFSSRICMKTS